MVGSGYSLLVVHPSVEAKTVQELIVLAKSKSGQLTFGSGGSGTTPHRAGELFKMMAGVQIEHIPCKGSPQSMLDLVAGRITMIFANGASALPQIKAGKIRVLGVTTPQRLPEYPDIPTISEAGVPGFATELWVGISASAGTPPQIVNRPNQEIRKGLANEAIIKKYAAPGFVIKTGTPQAYDAYIREETVKWGKVVKASGAKP